ncbi:juvenile hormone acid O-methyltransferase-like [Haematobia irritans]|uniref:juvenile hormone acid O-methyltransferase-like n=1 Tax=Haematobia irritans TaxID=7368 RepID=UPI003F50BB24
MNHPELYHKANEVQRHDSQTVLEEYATKIQWRYDGEDSLIDLGSGCGDVLVDFVYPRMPLNFKRLVCSDINPQMVNYARKNYGYINGLEFQLFDMETSEELPNDLRESFDHVTSFYALMWVKNERQALQNIYDLLRPEGGDCLLTFLASHPTIAGYKLARQMEKWSKYMHDLDSVLPVSLQNSSQPAEEFSQLMSTLNFTEYTVDVQDRIFVYDSLEVFKENMKAVNPFLDRIPVVLHEEYMNDIMAMILKCMDLPRHSDVYKISFPVSYKILIVYARK